MVCSGTPVGAEDADLLVTHDIFPLSESFAAVRRAFDREGEHANKLARIFNCAMNLAKGEPALAGSGLQVYLSVTPAPLPPRFFQNI